MLVEVCCSETSKLSERRESSAGCLTLRVTARHDLREVSTIKRVVKAVNEFRWHHPQGKLLVYASLPCTGGSPWGHVNKGLGDGTKHIEQHQRLFIQLQNALIRLVESVRDENTFLAYELSSRCEYWNWKCVRDMIGWYGLSRHRFHGCQLGLTNEHGQPMLKGWAVVTDVPSLSILDSYRCDRTHTHAQSRGKALKSAETYTYEYTDLVHKCFSQEIASGAMAAPVLLAEWDDEREIAENSAAWDDALKSLFVAMNWMELGNTETTKQFVRGMMNDFRIEGCTAATRDQTWPKSSWTGS